ncbi:2-oxo acid dehydrogenases acyltransferase (catalytic domain) domain-containing protein, partial [Toxoplasma gondii RUB]
GEGVAGESGNDAASSPI